MKGAEMIYTVLSSENGSNSLILCEQYISQ